MLLMRGSQLSLSLRAWVFHPNTRRHVRLLGPCFKTGRLKPLCQHPKHVCGRTPAIKACCSPQSQPLYTTKGYNTPEGTWVIDKPNTPKTPEGFKRTLVLRKDFSKLDAYFITPTGKRLRTRNEMASFIKANPEFKDVSPLDFDFVSPKIMEDTIPDYVVRKASSNGNGGSRSKALKEKSESNYQ